MKQHELSKVIEAPMEAVEPEVRAALAREGFGVLTRIDVAEVLRTKLGVERPAMCILGACNPHLAHAALETDRSAALVLPCNVVLEAEGDATRVSIADPRQLMPSSAYADLAEEAAGRLGAALAWVRSGDQVGREYRELFRPTTTSDASMVGAGSGEAEGSSTSDFAARRRPVEAVATLSPIYAKAGDSLRRVAERLNEEGIGIALIEMGEERPGAVSERDIVRALASGADPDKTQASDVMSETVLGVDAGDSLLDVANILVEHGVRHAPVLEDGHVIGVVSLRDLTSALLDAERRDPSK